MTNQPAYQSFTGSVPMHSFELMLDFSQPPLLDASAFVSAPTPNNSHLSITGVRDGWLAGIESVVVKNIDQLYPVRRLFHGPFTYDYGLLIAGIPFCFYLCWLSASRIQSVFGEASEVLVIAGYVYVFFVGLWLYRTLFSYTKWAFPKAELSDQKSLPRRHRLAWWAIVVALSLHLFWDFFGPYISARYFWGLFSS